MEHHVSELTLKAFSRFLVDQAPDRTEQSGGNPYAAVPTVRDPPADGRFTAPHPRRASGGRGDLS